MEDVKTFIILFYIISIINNAKYIEFDNKIWILKVFDNLKTFYYSVLIFVLSYIFKMYFGD